MSQDGQSNHEEALIKAFIVSAKQQLVSCVPGQLGYYEGEGPDDRRILVRRAT
jgi:hypothetical protein